PAQARAGDGGTPLRRVRGLSLGDIPRGRRRAPGLEGARASLGPESLWIGVRRMKTAELDRYLTDYSRISSWNRIKFEKLGVVLSHMRDEGIDYILLKGADVVPRLYGVLGLRALGDVDMLVHEFELPRLDQVLTQLGYRPRIDGNPAYADRDGILALDI